MIRYFIKRYHWNAVHRDGPKRVESARWFLRKMQQGTTKEEVSYYWGTGSDVIYYLPQNVKDLESKSQLNAIAKQMIEKCNTVGLYLSYSDPYNLD